MGMFALTLVLVAIGASWVLTREQPESISAIQLEDEAAVTERSTPSNTRPKTSLPARDVPGRDVPELPRYPNSVRVEYERKEQDLLDFTQVRYLSHARVDVIRSFYRGVFRAEGWKVANVEFSEGEWNFLVVHGEREATIEIEPHGRDVTSIDIVLSEPLPKKQPTQKVKPQKREAKPAPQDPAPPQTATPTSTPAPQSASPAPQSVSPTPAPQPAPAPDDDYYEGGGDDGDDLDDDGGGDD
jgi:hypothetical protein